MAFDHFQANLPKTLKWSVTYVLNVQMVILISSKDDLCIVYQGPQGVLPNPVPFFRLIHTFLIIQVFIGGIGSNIFSYA